MQATSELIALGYIGIRSARLEDWNTYATRLLGMQRVDRAGAVRAFRMDDRKQRLIVTGDEGEGLSFLGWEVRDAAALDALAARLEAHGVAVRRGSRRLAGERHVADLILFEDPAGNRLEVFHHPAVAADPFQPGRPISGFRTGPLGMGHAVLNVEDVEPLLPFYRDLLGFRDQRLRARPRTSCTSSTSMAGTTASRWSAPARSGLHHFMVELLSLDDVGQGYDLAQLEDGRVAYTLGRHTNDHMVSWYSHSPSGFFVEYGWAGRVIDPATWQPHETFDGPSFWGHERLYKMPPEQRARLRQMRLSAAAKGLRAPVIGVDCPWLDAVITRE